MDSMRQEYAELDQGLKRWKSVQKTKGNEDRERELLRLTKALESMRPEKAAATLSALTQETAALLLGRLSDRSSGKVLAVMAPERAALLVQQLLADTAPPDQQALRALGQAQPAVSGAEQEAGE
jgi:flagellar motility protein MotE (MotC chaperone)